MAFLVYTGTAVAAYRYKSFFLVGMVRRSTQDNTPWHTAANVLYTISLLLLLFPIFSLLRVDC